MNPFEKFEKELIELINKHSMELHFGNTPDFILAKFALGCLILFGNRTRDRDEFNGEFEPAERQGFIDPEKSMMNPDNWTDEMRADAAVDPMIFSTPENLKSIHVESVNGTEVNISDFVRGVSLSDDFPPLVFGSRVGSENLGFIIQAWKKYGENTVILEWDSIENTEFPNEQIIRVVNKVLAADAE